MGFVGRPSGSRPPWRAPTIAVRSVRSGLPLRHPRPRLRRLLRIPSGASRLPATGAACPRGYVRLGLSRCWTCGQGREFSGRQLWPRGRPQLALVCLQVMRVRCARVTSGFLMVSHVREGAVVVGAAQSVLRVTSLSRRPQTVEDWAALYLRMALWGAWKLLIRRRTSTGRHVHLLTAKYQPYAEPARAASQLARPRVSLKRPPARPA